MDLQNTLRISESDGKTFIVWIQELDTTGSRISTSGKSYTEYTTYSMGKSVQITDDTGKVHNLVATIFTAIPSRTKPVQSVNIEKMTKAQLKAQLAKMK